MSQQTYSSTGASGNRFSTFAGVFTPSILTILGVIMYLRMGWVVGNAGLGGTLIIVGLSHLISYSTGLSVASIATNRTVGAGGAYYMISRSLGPAAGAAIGIPLFLAQALSVTFYVVGFTESILQLYPGPDPRLIGTVVLVLLTLVSYVSAALALRVQYFVMGAIGLSLLSFFLGGSETPPEAVAWWNPEGAGFSTVFAVFFPAVTGIMAGVSMSGDLKNPRKSLPQGTLLAITVGLVIYTAFPIWLAYNADTETLLTRLDVVWQISLVPLLIYPGIWGATLSSALGSILAAPRTLQALAADRLVFPVFARGHGPGNEPRIGLAATFVLAEIGVLLGNLDAIAPVLTMFFLATYGVTNLAFGLERWAASPSFRPSFEVPSWVGLSGAIACFYVMSIINLAAMFGALIFCAFIYVWAKQSALDTTFGDARHGIWSAMVLRALQQLRRAEYHELNWRPNLIILAGNLAKRSYLLEFGNAMVQDRGIVTYLHLLRGAVEEEAPKRKDLQRVLNRQFTADYPNVFCRVDVTEDIYDGCVAGVQSYGIGTLEANTVLMGWITKIDRAVQYNRMLRRLRALDRSLIVVRFDPDRGFGLGNRIDIWWRGLRSNGAMMLMLAFLLTADDRFRDAQVRVMTVVEREKLRQLTEKRLEEIVEKTRLDVTARVLVRDGDDSIASIMHRESARADLVMMGLQLPPDDEQRVTGFMRANREILSGLPTTVMVSSAPSFVGTPVLFDEE